MVLYTEDLTDKQFLIAGKAAEQGYPVILDGTAAQSRVANNLEASGWGTVEDGASGQRIFRLSQDGEFALAWLNSWKAA